MGLRPLGSLTSAYVKVMGWFAADALAEAPALGLELCARAAPDHAPAPSTASAAKPAIVRRIRFMPVPPVALSPSWATCALPQAFSEQSYVSVRTPGSQISSVC